MKPSTCRVVIKDGDSTLRIAVHVIPQLSGECCRLSVRIEPDETPQEVELFGFDVANRAVGYGGRDCIYHGILAVHARIQHSQHMLRYWESETASDLTAAGAASSRHYLAIEQERYRVLALIWRELTRLPTETQP